VLPFLIEFLHSKDILFPDSTSTQPPVLKGNPRGEKERTKNVALRYAKSVDYVLNSLENITTDQTRFIYFRNRCGAHYIWWTFYVAWSYAVLRWSTPGPWKCWCCPFFFFFYFVFSVSSPYPFLSTRETHTFNTIQTSLSLLSSLLPCPSLLLSLPPLLSPEKKSRKRNKTTSTDHRMRMFILVSLTDPLHFGFNSDHWTS